MRATRVLAVLALVGGSAGAFAFDLWLFMVDDSCPQWEDEGTMAAPDSPYSLLMCGPGVEPPFTWAVYAGCLVALVLTVAVLARPPRRRTVAAGLVLLVLLSPTALVGVLHLSLPQDCLSGETDGPGCIRDRELR